MDDGGINEFFNPKKQAGISDHVWSLEEISATPHIANTMKPTHPPPQNTLASARVEGAHWRKRNLKFPVTIITGIVCKDMIVLASDSQTAYGTSKHCDATKITTLNLTDARALVAQSGSATHSSRAVEILEGLAKDQSLSDYRTVPELAQKAMRQLKDEIRFQNCDCTMEWLHDYILKNGIGCELMLAYFFDGKPYIYTIDLMVGLANRVNSHYAAIGCGANLGSYLLSEHTKPNMPSKLAQVVSIYVVEMVKKHDAFCGGPTKLGAVRRPPKPNCHSSDVETFTAEEIEKVAKDVMEIEESTKEERNTKILEKMNEISDEMLEKIIAGVLT